MKPPVAEGNGSDAAPLTPPAVSLLAPERLRQRADFLRAAAARRQTAAGFLLQARERRDDSAAVRVGFTCSKKVGNSVLRNRARRRLREVARAVLPGTARPGWDYVLVGRPGVTVDRALALLLEDLRKAMARLHGEAT